MKSSINEKNRHIAKENAIPCANNVPSLVVIIGNSKIILFLWISINKNIMKNIIENRKKKYIETENLLLVSSNFKILNKMK